MKRKVRVVKITKGEKLLYGFAGIAITLTVLFKIFFGATISNLHMNASKTNKQIETASKKVESLTMKVNELTSFDKVKDIVKDMGLAYNNDNIIIISE